MKSNLHYIGVENKAYIYEGICDHYNNHFQRDIVDMTRIYILCKDEQDVYSILTNLPTKDMLVKEYPHPEFACLMEYIENEDQEPPNHYRAHIFIKDVDKEECLRYLNNHGYVEI